MGYYLLTLLLLLCSFVVLLFFCCSDVVLCCRAFSLNWNQNFFVAMNVWCNNNNDNVWGRKGIWFSRRPSHSRCLNEGCWARVACVWCHSRFLSQQQSSAHLLPRWFLQGFFSVGRCFSLEVASPWFFFLFPFESIWENKRRQVAYLVCLCNPSSPLMGFSFLHFFVCFLYFSLSLAHRLVKSLLTSSFSRVSSGERLPPGARHGVETVHCTFCNQSCFILYIQIDIYAHDVIWFYKWKVGEGRGADVSVD